MLNNAVDSYTNNIGSETLFNSFLNKIFQQVVHYLPCLPKNNVAKMSIITMNEMSHIDFRLRPPAYPLTPPPFTPYLSCKETLHRLHKTYPVSPTSRMGSLNCNARATNTARRLMLYVNTTWRNSCGQLLMSSLRIFSEKSDNFVTEGSPKIQSRLIFRFVCFSITS